MGALTEEYCSDEIHCDGCAAQIKRILGHVEGVSSVDVDVARKRVTVAHDGEAATSHRVSGALVEAGFPVKPCV